MSKRPRKVMLGVLLLALFIGCTSHPSFKSVTDHNKQWLEAIKEGDSALKSGDFRRALEAYQKAQALIPNHRDAQSKIAEIYLQLQEYGKARDTFIALLKLDSTDTNAGNSLGFLYENKLQNYEAAAQQYEQVLKIDPKNLHALIHLGRVYTRLERLSEAEAVLLAALEIDPKLENKESKNVYNYLAAVHIEREDFAGAIEAFGKHAEFFPAANDCAYVDLPQRNLGSADKNYIIGQSMLTPITEEYLIDLLADRNIQQTIVYYDGLGKTSQSAAIKASPLRKDIFTPIKYNELGVQTVSYLPYAANSDKGKYQQKATADQEAFYRSAQQVTHSDYPFAETVQEKSPLLRTLEQGHAGEAWQPTDRTPASGHTMKTRNGVNETHDVRLWWWDAAAGRFHSYGFYTAGTLARTELKDENGHNIVEYKDKSDRLILKRAMTRNQDGSLVSLNTYYVYDDFGDLRFIIPPEAARAMDVSGWFIDEARDRKWVTEFIYDGYHRVVEKRPPGADPIYTVYDKLGRPILSQDGELRRLKQWVFTKYDVLGRMVLAGILSDFRNRIQLQNAADQATAYYEERASGNYDLNQGYTNRAFPISDYSRLLSVMYYDDYDFNNDGQTDFNYSVDTEFRPNQPFYRLQNKITATKTRVLKERPLCSFDLTFPNSVVTLGDLDSEIISDDFRNALRTCGISLSADARIGVQQRRSEWVIIEGLKNCNYYLRAEGGRLNIYRPSTALDLPDWLMTVSFYDKYGRVIQTFSRNTKGANLATAEFDFAGKVLKTKTIQMGAAATLTIRKRFAYDHAGRLVKTYHQTNNDPEILLVANGYNELGQLIEKNLHSENDGASFLQSIDYTYNIRGWLTQINEPGSIGYSQTGDAGVAPGDLFGMQLCYNDSIPHLINNPQYNGNISAVAWAIPAEPRYAVGPSGPIPVAQDPDINSYTYEYDWVNQLTNAHYRSTYGAAYQPDGAYDESASYDLNGNIMTMARHGLTDSSNLFYGLVDDLTYFYNGNQLRGVDDVVPNDHGYDFFDKGGSKMNTGQDEYLYDANGNMIRDKNKGIQSVLYNHLNLPKVVDFGNGKKIFWTYSAAGEKLRKTVLDNSRITKTIDYVNGIVYENNTLDFFATDEGRVKKLNRDSLRYEYNLTDHLGNVRVSFTKRDAGISPKVLQEDHYYPFGMKLAGLTQVNSGQKENKFTYNGKELEDEHGLNWYHYGARFYDPQLGRWHTMDPAEEFHSSYLALANNPIRVTDPDGSETYVDENNNPLPRVIDRPEDPRVFMVMNEQQGSSEAVLISPDNISTFSTPQEAAWSALRSVFERAYVVPIPDRVEWGGVIYIDDKGRFRYTEPRTDYMRRKVDPFPKGGAPGKVVGWYHTHYISDDFSTKDYIYSNPNGQRLGGIYGYLASPSGDFLIYNPGTGEKTTIKGGMTYWGDRWGRYVYPFDKATKPEVEKVVMPK